VRTVRETGRAAPAGRERARVIGTLMDVTEPVIQLMVTPGDDRRLALGQCQSPHPRFA